MIAIAPKTQFPEIDRVGLAQRVEAAEATYGLLMQHGLDFEPVRMACHGVAGHLIDHATRLRAGLEAGASDQDLFADFVRLVEFETAAEVWLERTERYPHLGEAPGEITSA